MPAPNTTRVYYSTDNATYTEVPLPCISIDESPGQTEEIDRRHLNQTGNLAVTSPGERSCGETTLNLELNTRTATHMDFIQLVHETHHKSGTDPLYWRVTYPKPTGTTTPGKREFTGYVKQGFVPPTPEQGRMTIPLVIKQNSEVVHTDAS